MEVLGAIAGFLIVAPFCVVCTAGAVWISVMVYRDIKGRKS